MGELVVGLAQKSGRDSTSKALVDGTSDLGSLTCVLQDAEGVWQSKLGSSEVSRSESRHKLSNSVRSGSSVPVLGESFGYIADGTIGVGLHAQQRRDGLVVGYTTGTFGTVSEECRDERVFSEDDDNSVRVKEELVVVVDGFLGVLAVELVRGGKIKLTTVLLGELDVSLESIRVGIVIVYMSDRTLELEVWHLPPPLVKKSFLRALISPSHRL